MDPCQLCAGRCPRLVCGGLAPNPKPQTQLRAPGMLMPPSRPNPTFFRHLFWVGLSAVAGDSGVHWGGWLYKMGPVWWGGGEGSPLWASFFEGFRCLHRQGPRFSPPARAHFLLSSPGMPQPYKPWVSGLDPNLPKHETLSNCCQKPG